MCMDVLPAHVCASRDSIARGDQKRASDTLELLTDDCKLSCRCYELILGPL